MITLNQAQKILGIVDAGLTDGIGKPEPGKMCVEAAVSYGMGYHFSDNPECVGAKINGFMIQLNDSFGGSRRERAQALRRLAIAHLGTRKLDEGEFARRLLSWAQDPQNQRYYHPEYLQVAQQFVLAGDAAEALGFLAPQTDGAIRRMANAAADILQEMGSEGSKFLFLMEDVPVEV